ncbi:MAG: DUF4139 domain-containing protein [Candidatus Eisenbacteria bacterium]
MFGNPFRSAAPVIATILLAAAAAAETPRFAVTVYNRDLGLVRERRVIEVEKGETAYSFQGVAARIDPTSVHFRTVDGKGGGLAVVEQNYEYDLVSSDKIFEKYLDHPVEVFFQEGGDVLSGVLLSFQGGNVVLRDREGDRLSVVLDGVRNVELLGSAEDFVTRPTLVWKLDSGRAGEREVEVEYLTGGLSWHAEYVALADEPNENVLFAGWVSVENRSGAAYPEAKLKLVAGDVGRAPEPRDMMMRAEAMSAKGAPDVEERALFEYHLYEIRRPTTLRENQVKQISFVPGTTVPVVKEYVFDTRRGGSKVAVYFELKNEKESGLGIALPAGKVRMFQDDGRGGSEFIGEDRIDHTPKDEEVRLRVGYAFDIVGERKVTDERRISDRIRTRTVEIELRNRKEEAVEVVVREGIEADWEMEEESLAHRKEDAQTAEWTVPLQAGEVSVLRYTVRIRY